MKTKVKIKQCRMSPSFGDIFNSFMDRYNFKQYTDRNKPVFFYGCYYTEPETIKRHKSLLVMIWRGSDILLPGHLKCVLKHPYTKHVAISSFIANDLKNIGVKYKFLPITGSDTSIFLPCPLGDEIYAYVPETRKDFYGLPIIEILQKKCKYKINIINGYNKYTREELIKIYSRCFCGFRFTPHDGIANQVIEMGLMGRKSFYNGDVPGAIKWERDNINNILANIDIEAQQISNINHQVANEMKKFIDIGNDWLTTSYWGW